MRQRKDKFAEHDNGSSSKQNVWSSQCDRASQRAVCHGDSINEVPISFQVDLF